jgi:hypothetical protein
MSQKLTHRWAIESRRVLGRAVACGVLVALGVAGVAYADEPQEPIRIEYTAPAGCPEADAFVGEILARTPRARRSTDDAPARTFVVSVTKGAEASFGRLIIRNPDGTESERDMTGDTCGEVVSALALVTALTVDPKASTKPVVPLAASPSTSGTAPASTASASATAPKSARSSAASTSPTPSSAPSPPPPPSPPPREPWHLALTVDASVVSAVAPGVLFGIPVIVEATAPKGRAIAPTFRLGFEYTSTGSIDVGGPTATFKWTLGIAEACPHRWYFGDLSLEPCARVEVGALEGAGANIIPSRDSTRLWLAAGPVGRLNWAFLPTMFVDLEAGVRFPLARTTYYFEPATVIYSPPTAGMVVSGGLGVRFL